ncbi:MAG TPA: ATP-binding protein [Kofleriaceae bacterium]|jgi:hypothetical protein|nr:ATP-binding protein [Kofleriaceae bacterium]
MSTALCLEVELQPEWDNVTRASEAVALLALGSYGDGDLRDALAMVSGELLENAIKYASPQTLVKLAIRESASAIVVEVTNAIVGNEEIQRLADQLAWLASHQDPAEAWAAALAQVTTERRERGGLGILRIANEGGSRIDYAVPSPGVLTVRASMSKAPANE